MDGQSGGRYQPAVKAGPGNDAFFIGWLGMGDSPGWTLWHANGFKVRTLDHLPQRLLDHLKTHHPHALLTPGEGNWKGMV